MAGQDLLETILDDRIREPRFVNGALLSAEDLSDGLLAGRRRHEQWGQALGTGVVQGLEVGLASPGDGNQVPSLWVKRGLAINPKGQALSLAVDLPALSLRLRSPPVPTGPGLFAPCPTPPSSIAPADRGVYVLLLSPTAGVREQRPVRGPVDGTVIGCDSRYAVAGVSFRLTQMPTAKLDKPLQDLIANEDPASLSKLRNWIAHLFFGTEGRPAADADPGATGSGAPELPGLDDCDVPLALLFWSGTRVRFVDMWAVRRPAAQAPVLDELSSGVPILLQFRHQVADLIAGATQASPAQGIRAKDYFRYLPAVAEVPLGGVPGHPGFDLQQFFGGMTVRGPVVMEGRKRAPLLHQSLGFRPVDTTSGEMLWLYLVRENRQAPDSGTAPPPYLVFAHGHTPYQGDARLDQSYWDFSNYSIGAPLPGG
jgi:hypothetical protein